ncbi:MAG: glycosyltransferase family 39 protein, partial [Bacteroidota bacterium]
MSRQTWTDVAVVTVLALAVRAGAVWLTGFDGMYGQDAFAYLRQIRFLAEHGPAAWLQPNAFAWPHAYPFIWPSGYPLAAVLPAWVSGSDIWAGQFTSLLFGSLTPAVLYLVAARMGNRPAGWIAGGVGVVAAFPVQASTVVMADAGGLFWASLALWSVVEARERSRPETWVVLAALAAGAAAITRWAFGLTWPALALFGAYVLVKRRRSLAWLLVGVVPALGLVGIEWWVDSALTSDSLALWHPVHAAQRTFEINSGTFAYTHPMSVYWILALAHPAYLVPPMTVLAGLGAWRLWHTDQPVALLLLGWVVCVYGFLAGMPFQNLRFGLTYFSPAVVLA